MNVIHRWVPPQQHSQHQNGFFRRVRDYIERNGDTDQSELNRHFDRPARRMSAIMAAMRKRGQVEKVGSAIANGQRCNVWRVNAEKAARAGTARSTAR